MQVKVSNGVPRVFADVEDQTVTPLIETFNPRHFLGNAKHRSQVGGVFGANFVGRIDVTLWDYQHVRWSSGVQITKCQRLIVLRQNRGRNRAGNDSTEQARFGFGWLVHWFRGVGHVSRLCGRPKSVRSVGEPLGSLPVPEGHTIHRLAKDHSAQIVGEILVVSSPQGRMADGAATLDGMLLAAVEPYGKHLFYRFGDKGPQHATTVHVHLGLFGKFRSQPSSPKDPVGAIRMRMIGQRWTVDLSGPTDCRIIEPDEETSIRARLGPDPIRSDADPDLAWARISKRRSTIGEALMDQKVLAGVGNVYRAEALFVCGVHPMTPCPQVPRETFDQIWKTLVEMLRQGVADKRIITVSKSEIAEFFDKPRSRVKGKEAVYVYKRDRCLRCQSSISRWDLAGRWAYACVVCQPLIQ
jgi:endonuclease VIII